MSQGLYKIDELLGKGSFGNVYKVIDTDDPSLNLIAKIQTSKSAFKNEVLVLNSIKDNEMFPKIYASG